MRQGEAFATQPGGDGRIQRCQFSGSSRELCILAQMLEEICFRREIFVVHYPVDAMPSIELYINRHNPNGLSQDSDSSMLRWPRGEDANWWSWG
jgi:hypothetical protein